MAYLENPDFWNTCSNDDEPLITAGEIEMERLGYLAIKHPKYVKKFVENSLSINYKELSLNQKKEHALNKFIILCRDHRLDFIKSLSWPLYNDPMKNTLAEYFIRSINFELPKINLILNRLSINYDEASEIHNIWKEAREQCQL